MEASVLWKPSRSASSPSHMSLLRVSALTPLKVAEDRAGGKGKGKDGCGWRMNRRDKQDHFNHLFLSSHLDSCG